MINIIFYFLVFYFTFFSLFRVSHSVVFFSYLVPYFDHYSMVPFLNEDHDSSSSSVSLVVSQDKNRFFVSFPDSRASLYKKEVSSHGLVPVVDFLSFDILVSEVQGFFICSSEVRLSMLIFFRYFSSFSSNFLDSFLLFIDFCGYRVFIFRDFIVVFDLFNCRFFFIYKDFGSSNFEFYFILLYQVKPSYYSYFHNSCNKFMCFSSFTSFSLEVVGVCIHKGLLSLLYNSQDSIKKKAYVPFACGKSPKSSIYSFKKIYDLHKNYFFGKLLFVYPRKLYFNNAIGSTNYRLGSVRSSKFYDASIKEELPYTFTPFYFRVKGDFGNSYLLGLSESNSCYYRGPFYHALEGCKTFYKELPGGGFEMASMFRRIIPHALYTLSDLPREYNIWNYFLSLGHSKDFHMFTLKQKYGINEEVQDMFYFPIFFQDNRAMEGQYGGIFYHGLLSPSFWIVDLYQSLDLEVFFRSLRLSSFSCSRFFLFSPYFASIFVSLSLFTCCYNGEDFYFLAFNVRVLGSGFSHFTDSGISSLHMYFGRPYLKLSRYVYSPMMIKGYHSMVSRLTGAFTAYNNEKFLSSSGFNLKSLIKCHDDPFYLKVSGETVFSSIPIEEVWSYHLDKDGTKSRLRSTYLMTSRPKVSDAIRSFKERCLSWTFLEYKTESLSIYASDTASIAHRPIRPYYEPMVEDFTIEGYEKRYLYLKLESKMFLYPNVSNVDEVMDEEDLKDLYLRVLKFPPLRGKIVGLYASGSDEFNNKKVLVGGNYDFTFKSKSFTEEDLSSLLYFDF